jgi:hypothetical protein
MIIRNNKNEVLQINKKAPCSNAEQHTHKNEKFWKGMRDDKNWSMHHYPAS